MKLIRILNKDVTFRFSYDNAAHIKQYNILCRNNRGIIWDVVAHCPIIGTCYRNTRQVRKLLRQTTRRAASAEVLKVAQQ